MEEGNKGSKKRWNIEKMYRAVHQPWFTRYSLLPGKTIIYSEMINFIPTTIRTVCEMMTSNLQPYLHYLSLKHMIAKKDSD